MHDTPFLTFFLLRSIMYATSKARGRMIGTRIEKTNPVIINLSRERRQLGSHASVRKKNIAIMHFTVKEWYI